MSTEDRSSQPAQRPYGILRFPHGFRRGQVCFRGNDTHRGTGSREEAAV